MALSPTVHNSGSITAYDAARTEIFLLNYSSGSFRGHEDIYSIANDQLTASEHRSKNNVTKLKILSQL